MAERLPVVPSRNIKSHISASLVSNITSTDIPNGCIDQVHSQLTSQELESSLSNSHSLSNGSSNASNSGAVQGNPEATRNGGRTKEGDSCNENEWVEQDEPGVYILTSLPGCAKDLKWVRFSRKQFSEKQAEQWCSESRKRVYDQYNVETLTQKAQLQEAELERTNRQLKEAIEIAEEETAKLKAAKQVIKSLTAQLKELAERLPVVPSRNIKSPKSASLVSNITSTDLPHGCIDQVHSQLTSQELESSLPNSHFLSNGSSNASNSVAIHNRQRNTEATRNEGRTKEGDSRNENERFEQVEPGVYITLTSLPGGVKDLKRIRFSRRRFSEKQAVQWWAENRERVYKQYNVCVIDKSSIGTGSEDQAH